MSKSGRYLVVWSTGARKAVNILQVNWSLWNNWITIENIVKLQSLNQSLYRMSISMKKWCGLVLLNLTQSPRIIDENDLCQVNSLSLPSCQVNSLSLPPCQVNSLSLPDAFSSAAVDFWKHYCKRRNLLTLSSSWAISPFPLAATFQPSAADIIWRHCGKKDKLLMISIDVFKVIHYRFVESGKCLTHIYAMLIWDEY